MRPLAIRSIDLAALGPLPKARARKAIRPNFDLIGAGILAFFMWPLIFWVVDFVAQQRGF